VHLKGGHIKIHPPARASADTGTSASESWFVLQKQQGGVVTEEVTFLCSSPDEFSAVAEKRSLL